MGIIDEVNRHDDVAQISAHKDNFVNVMQTASDTVDAMRQYKTTYPDDAGEIETLISQGRTLVQNLLDKIDSV